jgi:hypothetical protein
LVLLPVLAKTTTPPDAVGDWRRARLLPASAASFAPAAAWVKEPAQQALVDALKKVTEETDYRKAFVFAQPYGVDGVSPELVRARLYTELSDPPTLSAAQHMYMPMLDRLEIIANVEATRLASEGKVDDAMELMLRMTFFGRQMTDRAFAAEASWGLRCMQRSLERMRDVAYFDSKNGKKLDLTKLRNVIDRLSFDTQVKGGGYLEVTRMQLPEGSRSAAQQLIARVYDPAGEVKPDVFARTMAKVGTAGKPLRLFSEAARWRGASGTQVKRDEATRLLDGVFTDWRQRWQLGWYDRYQDTVSKFSELSKSNAVVITSTLADIQPLRNDRQLVSVELSGTRSALATLAFWYRNTTFPPTISSSRPQWTHKLDNDPYNLQSPTSSNVPCSYVRPGKDGGEANKNGIESVIVTEDVDGKSTSFRLTFKEDTVLIFSVGSDNANNVAKQVQNTATVVRGADYLIWPPLVGLYRQHLTDLGEIK